MTVQRGCAHGLELGRDDDSNTTEQQQTPTIALKVVRKGGIVFARCTNDMRSQYQTKQYVVPGTYEYACACAAAGALSQ